MNVVHGAQVRINVNLRLRKKPATTADTIVAVQAGVLVTALGPPANGWMKARVRGWEHEDHPGLVFSEAHASASISARNGGGLGWRQVEYVGYLSMANPSWWTVEDGPK
jgi:hypothetical protein